MMIERAAVARKAARLVHRDNETAKDPTCAHHVITNIFGEGRKAKDGVVREMMNTTDEMAATNTKKVMAMHTSAGLFSSPSCAFVYQ
eukprot:6204486-Pleurochrysis_carterae.AAC.2